MEALSPEQAEQGFLRSRAFRIAAAWLVFAAAIIGTVALSRRLESTSNAASAYLSGGNTYEVSLYEGRAEPNQVEIKPGDTVAFTVKDESRHNIAEERSSTRDTRVESGEIGRNESYDVSFSARGTHYFYDRMDAEIHATVVVK